MRAQYPERLFSFVWQYLVPYRWYLFGLILTGVFHGIQTSLTPYLLKLIINNVVNYSGNKSEILSAVQTPSVVYMIIFTLAAFNFRMSDWLILKSFPSIKKDITIGMFSYLERHSYQYFQDNFAGSLLNKINDMVNGVSGILKKSDQLFANIACFLIATIAMFSVHRMFGFILLVWAFVFIGIFFLFSKKVKKLSYSFSKSKTILSGMIVDSISNMGNVRIFSREDFEVELIKKSVLDTVYKDRNMQSYILKRKEAQDLSIVLLMGSMLYALVTLYSKGLVTIGDFAFVLTVSMSIFQSIWFLTSQLVEFAEEIGRCAQAFSIIITEHSIKEAPDAKEINVQGGKVEFRNVTFYYSEKSRIFDNLNVVIQPGSKVGLVGFSGSGKTTFVNLILRFFDVKAGKILVENQNIANVTQHSLHASIAMIPQDINLFHRSLMENIRYGDINATDAEVIEASKRAHCHEFISQLPEGYHALVGERGIKLSGGQRQRIAIARAFLKKSSLLILDEATSALDSVTEKYIHESLHLLMEHCTAIVIAHRLSTLSEMDRILVFDKGNIIEDGTHEALLKNQGHYAKMWRMQAGGFLPEKEE